MQHFLIVGAVMIGIYLARAKLGDLTYERIVGGFFLIVFALVGIVLLYGYITGH